MTIEINPKEHRLTINIEGGTREAIGHLARINNFPVSLHMQNEQLILSDVKSGCVIAKIDINTIDFWQADTKEKAIQLFEDKLAVVDRFMTDKLIDEIKEKRLAFPKVKAPEPIENYEVFVKEFMEGADE